MRLENKQILVVGLGVTGFKTAQFLKRKGADVIVTDSRDESHFNEYASILHHMNIHLELGHHKTHTFNKVNMIVLSPGVPHTLPMIEGARQKGIPVLGEIEIASRYIHQPIIAVTGTNGKTTTTALLGDMLKRSGYKVFVGGNIGNPLIEYAGQKEEVDMVVAEISSFQLDTIDGFRPKVGVLLNISEDHLDRYTGFESYVASKGRLFENQKATDIAVLNESDPHVRQIGKQLCAKKMTFYFQNETDIQKKEGARIQGQSIILNMKGKEQKRLDYSRMGLRGRHNIENIAAASLAALSVGGTAEGIQSAIDAFKGPPHRIEYVDSINGVSYYNDSKATNIDAVSKALESFDKPVILIMGGRDKGGSFKKIKDLVSNRSRLLITMGEARESIRKALGSAIQTESVLTLKEAVVRASQLSVSGDIVLLSPGCSSFDMFTNYAERGELFCQLVISLR